MRLRRHRGRLVVTTSDGRQVQYALALFALPALALLLAAAALVWLAPRREAASLGRDLRVMAENLLAAEPVSHRSALPTIELVVGTNVLTELAQALASGDPALRHEPGGDRPFLNALYLEGSQPVPCEIALTDLPGRFDPGKPSLRIKFRKVDARGGARRIDLQRPTDALALEAYQYASLARRLELLEDGSTPVRLFVNRKPFGVFLRALPPGPSLSRPARRLPGTFVFSEPGRDPWADAQAWQRYGLPATAPVPMADLLERLRAPRSPESSAALERLVDFESTARWAALRAWLGRGFHPGAQLCLYFAPAHGRVEPVAWSLDGAPGRSGSGLQEPGNALLERLELEPQWAARRDSWLARLIAEEGEFGAEFAAQEDALAPDLAGDFGLVELDPRDASLRPVSVLELDSRRSARRQDRSDRSARLAQLLADGEGTRAQAPPEPPQVVLGPGDVELREDLVTAPGQRLVLRAGTRVRLHPDVGIYARGPTSVEGTAQEPVVLRRATWEPWGTFALSGPATAGSRIEHLQLEGAAGGRLDHQVFAAQLCVYDCPDLVIASSRFARGGAGTDSLHLARTRARLGDCDFVDAREDALDAVFSQGLLEDCRFVVADRNAIDLFGSQFDLERCQVDCALRAGLSVGEGSHARLLDCEFKRCDLGIDCHDDSSAVVRSARFEANRVGVFAERRDWRHDRGGTVELDGCRFLVSREADVISGGRSLVRHHDCGNLVIPRGAHRVERLETPPAGWPDSGPEE